MEARPRLILNADLLTTTTTTQPIIQHALSPLFTNNNCLGLTYHLRCLARLYQSPCDPPWWLGSISQWCVLQVILNHKEKLSLTMGICSSCLGLNRDHAFSEDVSFLEWFSTREYCWPFLSDIRTRTQDYSSMILIRINMAVSGTRTQELYKLTHKSYNERMKPCRKW